MKKGLYTYGKRCEMFEKALEHMEERITDVNTKAAFHFVAWLNGSYFMYGHSGGSWFVKLRRQARKVPMDIVKQFRKNISRLASRYKVAALSHFDIYGEFKSGELKRKYCQRLNIY